MPKIFIYLGVVIFFYSNEHEPVHVHGKYQDLESKAELIIENGKVVEIKIKNVRGKQPLKAKILKNFKVFVKSYADEIVKKWIDCFVLNKEVQCQIIDRKIK